MNTAGVFSVVPATGTLSGLWILLVLPAFGAAVLLLGGRRANGWAPTSHAR